MYPLGVMIAGSAGAFLSSRTLTRARQKHRNRLLQARNRAPTTRRRAQRPRSSRGHEGIASRLCEILAPHDPKIKAEDTDIGSIEKWSGPYFVSSSVALPLALLGWWVPLFRILSIGILTWLTVPILRRSLAGLARQRRIKMEVVNLLTLPLMISSGYLPAAAFGYWSYYLGILFLARAKNRSVRQVSSIITESLRLVWVRKGDHEIEIDFRDLRLGDIVVVQAGGLVPVDGLVIEGLASVDQRMLTGEAQPVDKQAGDRIFAYTTVLAGKICIQAEKTGPQTVASQINDILEQTNNFAAAIESRVETAADCLALPTLALGALALPVAGYTSALVVLDSSIIDNLYITGNLNVLTHLHLASNQGVLVKDGRALETLRDVDTVVFDKTGTLTEEQPHVGHIHELEDRYGASDILYFAGIAEQKQSHPIAKAVLSEIAARRLSLPAVDQSRYELGYGITVGVQGYAIRVGSRRFMKTQNIEVTRNAIPIQAHADANGYSLVYVAVGSVLAGIIEIHPTVRAETKDLLRELKRRDLSTYIISGDHEAPTRALAAQVGIDHYLAETLPEDKAVRIQQLQAQGRTVCFIGDGINDAIALKQADVAISLSGAATIATDTAQVVLLDGSLCRLSTVFHLAESLQRNFRNSVLWDVLPNATCIVGAYFFGLGIYGALAIYTMGLAGGVISGMRPLVTRGAGAADGVAMIATPRDPQRAHE